MYGPRSVSALLGSVLLLTTCAPLYGATVEGIVFLDKDGDGKRGDGEAGVAEVAVCNGEVLVKTDARGRFKIPEGKPVGRAEHGFVFVNPPQGHWRGKRWYVRCPVEGPVDLALVEFPKGKQRDFCFAHLSDTQLVVEGDRGVPVALEELGKLDIEPVFIVNTGDLVGHRAEAYPNYKKVMATSALPVINIRGNHDVEYCTAMGPVDFTIDTNRFRFTACYGRRVPTWLKTWSRDLPAGMRVIEFNHFSAVKFAEARPFPASVLHLSGDSHINRIRRRKDGFLAIETTSYSYRKRDAAPVGYRILGFNNGKPYTYFRPAGFRRLFSAAMPSEGGVYRPGNLPVQVNAFSGAATPAKVEVAIGSRSAPPAAGWIGLKKQGLFAWGGRIDAKGVGPRKLHIRAETVGGQKWAAVRSFSLAAGKPLNAKPGKEAWRYLLENGGQSRDATLSPPLQVAWCAWTGGVIERVTPIVADGKVLQGSTWDSLEDFGGVTCFDAATGKLLWKKGVGAVRASPASDGKRLFVTPDDGSLRALMLADGSEVWRADGVSSLREMPPVYVNADNSKVYVAIGRKAPWKAYDVAKGTDAGTVARKELPEAKHTYPAAVAKLIFKNEDWRKQACGSEHRFLGQKVAGCTVVGNTGYATTGSGRVLAFAIPDGKVLWSIELGTPFIAPPVAVGNVLYAAGYNGYVYALIPRSK